MLKEDRDEDEEEEWITDVHPRHAAPPRVITPAIMHQTGTTLCVIGAALIALSCFGVVSFAIGGIGFGLGLVGTLAHFVASRYG
jgi:hypothetical protein